MKRVYTKLLACFLIGLFFCLTMPLYAIAECKLCREENGETICTGLEGAECAAVVGGAGIAVVLWLIFGIRDEDVFRDKSDAYLLYEGNNCTEELVGSLGTTNQRPGGPVSWNVKKKSFIENDEAKSVLIQQASAGEILRVYDDPGGGTGDDWTQITILRDIRTPRCIKSFEVPGSGRKRTFQDNFMQIEYNRDNDLDGKISHVETDFDEDIWRRYLMTLILPLSQP